MTSSAFAHDYAELEPLAPDLRSFLVTLLEDASASDYLDGDPDMFSAGPAKLSARLGRIIDVANDADMRWLRTADYEELDHPVFGRVPAGVVLQLLSDLVDTVAHAEDHADETPNAALSRDLIRLQALSETQWGQ
jgi:hypothetical protein